MLGRYFDYFKRKGAPDLALANMKKLTIRFNQMAKISRLSFFNCAQGHWSIREEEEEEEEEGCCHTHIQVGIYNLAYIPYWPLLCFQTIRHRYL